VDYLRAYRQLINKGLPRGLNKKSVGFVTERHHIIPRCQGGRNVKENYVLLTPKEHYVAHHLLCKGYPESASLFKAYRMMALMDSWSTSRDGACSLSATEYHIIKTRAAMLRVGSHHSPDALRKMRRPRSTTENMKKAKTTTPALIAEIERRRKNGDMCRMIEAARVAHTGRKWFNDGTRDMLCFPEDAGDLIPGRLHAHAGPHVYRIDGKEFKTTKELYMHLMPRESYNVWKRNNRAQIGQLRFPTLKVVHGVVRDT